jgi:predicted oxidoreductase
MDSDVIVIGTGLAGLVAAGEIVKRGNSVLVVEQENAA